MGIAPTGLIFTTLDRDQLVKMYADAHDAMRDAAERHDHELFVMLERLRTDCAKMAIIRQPPQGWTHV